MSKIARVEFDVIPDAIVKDTGLYCYLIATCNKYHNMLDKHILFFLGLTYDKRREYYQKVKNNELHKQLSETTCGGWEVQPTIAFTVGVDTSVWHMLLKEAVREQNTVAVEWLVKERGVKMDTSLTAIARPAMKHWLVTMGCPELKKKDHVVISGEGHDGVAGILIGIDGCDGIVKIKENSDIKIVHMSCLVKQ